MFVKVSPVKSIVLLLLILAVGKYAYANTVDLSATYAIVVATSSNKFTGNDLVKSYESRNHRYYVVRVKSEKEKKYQLRFGFFRSKKSAKNMQQRLKSYFGKTFIVSTTLKERKKSKDLIITPSSNVQMAEYLILSTTYKTASSIARVAGGALSEALKPEVISEPDAKEIKYDSYIVVNLKTTNNLSDFEKTIKHPEIENHAFYISELKIDGATWYQYRLGFFVDTAAAREKLNALTKDFPLARLIRVSNEEKEDATRRIRSFFAAVPEGKVKEKVADLPAVSLNKLKALMKKASAELSAKKYTEAIKGFSKLLRYPENEYSMDAQEFLGFSYELNGEVALARREYSRYLSLYPETRGADRVRQRMASLITARDAPKKGLRKSKRDIKDPKWQHFGSLTQFYRKDQSTLVTKRDESTLVEKDTRENLSLLSTDVNFSSRYRSNDYVMNSRFTGGHDLNMTGDENETSGSVSSLYFDVTDINNGLYGRIGRQSVSKDGVLGRMDGAQLGYKVNDYIKLNTVIGLVVDDTEKGGNSDKSFAGISADFGTFANAWDLNVYYIKQDDGPITGREAVGSEIRYFHPKRTLFTLIDYDVMFKELNTVLAIGNWQFDNKVQMNATVDIRKSPILTTSNALSGNALSIDELLLTKTEEEIRQLAIEQTATSKSFIVGLNAPLNEQFQISGDVTMTNLSSSMSGGLPVAGTDDEFYYNFQLIGNSVFMENDSSIFGLRFNDTDRAKTNSINANLRFPLTREWRINPRFRFDNLELTNGTEQQIVAMAVRFDYRLKRNLNFELDMGGENSDQALDESTTDTRSYFVNVGYRYDF